MRNIKTLIRFIKQVKGDPCIIKNPLYADYLNLYTGLNYKDIVLQSYYKTPDQVFLYDTSFWKLTIDLSPKFSYKKYNNCLIKVLGGNIMSSHYLNYIFLKKNRVYKFENNCILNNHTNNLSYLLVISKK